MKRKSRIILMAVCLVSMLAMTSCDLWWDTFGGPDGGRPGFEQPGGPGGPGGGPGGPGGGHGGGPR